MPAAHYEDNQHDGGEEETAENLFARGLHGRGQSGVGALAYASNCQLLVRRFEGQIVQENKSQPNFWATEGRRQMVKRIRRPNRGYRRPV
jgi:hypothetical protein